MELGLREWLIIGGAIVVVLIVLDGWRRMRGGGNNLKMEIDQAMVDLPEDDYNPELPGGGARILDQDGHPAAARQEPTLDELPTMDPQPSVQDDPLFSADDSELLSAPRKSDPVTSQKHHADLSESASSPAISTTSLSENTNSDDVGAPIEPPVLPVSSDVERDPLFDDIDSEPLAHLDEGISAARIVTAPAVESVTTVDSDQSDDDAVPFVDTIVRAKTADERSAPPITADIDPLFAPEATVETLDYVEPEVTETVEPDAEAETLPDTTELSETLIAESADNITDEAPLATSDIQTETDELADVEAPEMVSEDSLHAVDLTDDRVEAGQPSEPDSAALDEQSDTVFADVEESDEALSAQDNSRDVVTVQDDVLDLTFLHQMEGENGAGTEQAGGQATESPSSDSVDAENDIQPDSDFQAEMPFDHVHTEQHTDDDDDLIATLPEGFAISSETPEASDETDEAELDLSRPITELMQPRSEHSQPQQAAMDLDQPIHESDLSLPADISLEEQPSAQTDEQAFEPSAKLFANNATPQIADIEITPASLVREEPDFTATEPVLNEADLPAISALDADELLEVELVTPAMKPPGKRFGSDSEHQPGAVPDTASVSALQAEGQPLQKVPEADKVLVISVVAAKDQPGFNGRNLLQILLACGMRYGDMQIFHRYEDGIDQGAIQFSMANAVEPGYFDIDSMERLETRGVTFFMSMEEPRDVMNAYECMLGTAEAVAKNLRGNLLDENRSTMRSQTKEHYRERIRRFEMRKLKQSSGV